MQVDAQIICLKYPTAPESSFSQIAGQLTQNFDYLISKAEEFRICKQNLVLFSYSSGGGLAPGLTLHALKQGISFKKNVFISPFFDFRQDPPL